MIRRRWEDLAFDCLICVFCKLGFEDLTIAVPFVCRSWNKASLDPQCWRVLDFKDLDFSTKSKFIARFKELYQLQSFSFSSFLKLCISKSHGSVMELRIPSLFGASLHQDLVLTSIQCPKLKVLSLPTLIWNDDKQLPGLMCSWKEMEALEMIWKPISFLKMLEQIMLHCPNFHELNLCGFLNGKDAQAMIRCLPKLKRLLMSASFLRKDDLVMILDGCKDLEEVDVSRCRGLDVDDVLLKKAAKLSKFEFQGCKPEEIYGNGYNNYDDLFMELVFGY
ncbi:F-box/LRR-repeat protein At3g48880-like [Phalaenopsis equestris]|uniref:F-box/LRR-repeat protein At3g48880-like n=1 Tax=Phalaenopsis equestris TaxID=78828 RepID=UPI0009E21924|nr:F-box/LRR-repeat protein At3g48880-like [Phalaenopsis equestris]